MTAAMNTLLIANGEAGEIEGLSITYPDALGLERLCYHLTLHGIGVDGNTDSETYVATVDAFNGDVLEWDVRMKLSKPTGSSHIPFSARDAAKWKHDHVHLQTLACMWAGKETKLAYPALLIHNQPYLYVGYLGYGAPDAKAVYKGHEHIAIESKERHLVFRLSSTEYLLNEQSQRMAVKPILVHDRCYVPLEAAQAILPFSLRYDAKNKQIHFNLISASQKAAVIQ